VLFNSHMIDWCELQDVEGTPATWIPDLLDRLERQPTAELWQDLRYGLGVFECETWCRVSFAAIPRIAAIAEQSRGGDREEALDLGADIARSLRFYRDADDLVRSARDAYGTLPLRPSMRTTRCTSLQSTSRSAPITSGRPAQTPSSATRKAWRVGPGGRSGGTEPPRRRRCRTPTSALRQRDVEAWSLATEATATRRSPRTLRG
jgi:hypothetical protein